jgi:glycosyltransferase involved in cell wall biosynthesis
VKVDVVVPARRDTIDRLLYSLSLQTRPPDTVLIVSNEVSPKSVPGLSIEMIGFGSGHYQVGFMDVVLRRNIGIWESMADLIVFQDDDLIASPGMIEACIERTQDEPFVWGHHRYTTFTGRPWGEIMALTPEDGRPRESAPNREHGWQSCYAGMMASRRDFLIEVGGFDMMFLGLHAGEDQQLGRRMLDRVGKTRSFIYEPPFSWHPEEPREPRSWIDGPTNMCPDGSHEWDLMWYNGVQFNRCKRCPGQKLWSEVPIDNRVVVPYEHSRVQLKKEFI